MHFPLSSLDLIFLTFVLATMSQISTMVEEALGGIDRELASSLTQKQEKFDHWHGKIRESAKARQIEQKKLDELKRRAPTEWNLSDGSRI